MRVAAKDDLSVKGYLLYFMREIGFEVNWYIKSFCVSLSFLKFPMTWSFFSK